MGDSKYAFARVAILCTEQRDATVFTIDSFYQCMCEGGIASYCSQASDVTAYPAADPTTGTPWSSADRPGGANFLFDDGKNDFELRIKSKNNWTPEVSAQIDPKITWIGILVIVACVFCIIAQCKRRKGFSSGASQPVALPMYCDSVRSAGEAGSGAAASSGGEGGSAPGEPSAPRASDLPPPYDLVFDETPKPPTYEQVLQEEAKIGPDAV